MQDSWEAGDPYDYFMGRWSSLVSRLFIDWLDAAPGENWLDIGCGSGALSEVVLNSAEPARLTAVDQSPGFVRATQQRLGDAVRCEVGDAMALPFADSSFDRVISGLMLNFVPDPGLALAEMKRVTAPRGSVAVYIWDYTGSMAFLRIFWDAVVELDPGAADLHEATRFPHSDSDGLRRTFAEAGFPDTAIEPLEITTHFRDFDDYWQPFLGGQGPAPTYVLSLDASRRNRLRDHLREQLPIQADGSIPLTARAWAAKSMPWKLDIPTRQR
jgi:SAM-dependent methyltransferase